MFSSALLDVLKHGDPHRPLQLSLRDLKELVEDCLAALPEKTAPRPSLHSPDQSEGDVADVHFFPNPRAEEIRMRQAKEDLQYAIEGHTPSMLSQTFPPTNSPDRVIPPQDQGTRSLDEPVPVRVAMQQEVKHNKSDLFVPPSVSGLLKEIIVHTTPERHRDFIYSVTFSPDGRLLATGGPEYTILLWEVSSGLLLHTLTGRPRTRFSTTSSPQFCGVAFSPDGKTLAAGAPGQGIYSSKYTIWLWEVSSGGVMRTIGETDYSLPNVVFSPDGKTLASGGSDRAIRLWEVFSGRLLHTLIGHKDLGISVAFSPDGKTLASSGWDQIIKLWEVSSGRLLHTLTDHGAPIYSVAFSPDGKTLASGGRNQIIKLWEVSSGRVIKSIDTGHGAPIYSVAFSPDGKTLASGGSTKIIKLWGVFSGRLLHTLTGHRATIRSVAFSPDGKTLASGGLDRTIRLWGMK